MPLHLILAYWVRDLHEASLAVRLMKTKTNQAMLIGM